MIVKIHREFVEGTLNHLGWPKVDVDVCLALTYDPEEGVEIYSVKWRDASPDVEIDVDLEFIQKVVAAADECLRLLEEDRTLGEWWKTEHTKRALFHLQAFLAQAWAKMEG